MQFAGDHVKPALGAHLNFLQVELVALRQAVCPRGRNRGVFVAWSATISAP